MIFRWSQILADRENVDAARAQIAENFHQFFGRLAEADHDTALGYHAGRKLLRVFQQRESAFIASAGANRAIEPRHGFCVVVEDVRVRVEDDAKRFLQALKVGDENFDAAVGRQFANLTDGLGKNSGAADVVIVAVDARHHRVFQSQSRHGFGHMARFVPIDRFWTSFGDGAETATPRADITQQQKRRSLVIPALPNVRTLRRLAHSVQSQPAGQFLQIMEVVADRGFRPQPLRLWRAQRGAKLNLDQLGRSVHSFRFYQFRRGPCPRGLAQAITSARLNNIPNYSDLMFAFAFDSSPAQYARHRTERSSWYGSGCSLS